MNYITYAKAFKSFHNQTINCPSLYTSPTSPPSSIICEVSFKSTRKEVTHVSLDVSFTAWVSYGGHVISMCYYLILEPNNKLFKSLYNTSLSSPPSCIICDVSSMPAGCRWQCFLHSINVWKSVHIFICFMLGPWLSLTIFCFSRKLCTNCEKRKQQGKTLTSVKLCFLLDPLWFSFSIFCFSRKLCTMRVNT